MEKKLKKRAGNCPYANTGCLPLYRLTVEAAEIAYRLEDGPRPYPPPGPVHSKMNKKYCALVL